VTEQERRTMYASPAWQPGPPQYVLELSFGREQSLRYRLLVQLVQTPFIYLGPRFLSGVQYLTDPSYNIDYRRIQRAAASGSRSRSPSRELIFPARGMISDGHGHGLTPHGRQESGMPPSLHLASYPRRGRLASHQSLESTTVRFLCFIP
jgi:hypothetical protein